MKEIVNNIRFWIVNVVIILGVLFRSFGNDFLYPSAIFFILISTVGYAFITLTIADDNDRQTNEMYENLDKFGFLQPDDIVPYIPILNIGSIILLLIIGNFGSYALAVMLMFTFYAGHMFRIGLKEHTAKKTGP